ncbi:hypothetical protein MIND_00291800 [Mycena indigotica]|uniref:DUF6589 domain-containing protein n=1 Tax=Mycena indigotica TaxID=2126181 RepID=A0A8H6WCF5_9AGAR|nr:uncharacterized protein MIND_00291800 [Mycena indigotica]KAF7312767.1 hypothetical protein MIND_00291800 [Mycena indigotica]
MGILMSYKWTTDSVESISKASMEEVVQLLKVFQWILSYDNIQLAFRVFSQRLDNLGEFGSGCAATVYIKKGLLPFPPEVNHAFQLHRAKGMLNPITVGDVLDLCQKHQASIEARMIYHTLQFLLQTTDFNLGAYRHRESEIFKAPDWLDPLPAGKEHTASQYLLGSVNITETSYEDHVKLIVEWLKQLGIEVPEEQKKLGLEKLIAWCGDQLTIDRLRGLLAFPSWRFEFL